MNIKLRISTSPWFHRCRLYIVWYCRRETTQGCTWNHKITRSNIQGAHWVLAHFVL